ncbi:hypothetical protein DFH08DRAFT_833384 [Mycena albidolilacea]|uniref:Uncharacterized protein n=1 Tax=Mycena albidolilacea TaxID=1033008 RepID=A0AAD7F4V9_9AGAR|nr:hypothetical protein DFH08DRAFT_833384 [Mycena albidolilacea]
MLRSLLPLPPLLSLFCRASRSPYRGNSHAHRPAMRTVPIHAPEPAVTIVLSILVHNDFWQWRKTQRIFHAWSQAVDACTG